MWWFDFLTPSVLWLLQPQGCRVPAPGQQMAQVERVGKTHLLLKMLCYQIKLKLQNEEFKIFWDEGTSHLDRLRLLIHSVTWHIYFSFCFTAGGILLGLPSSTQCALEFQTRSYVNRESVRSSGCWLMRQCVIPHSWLTHAAEVSVVSSLGLEWKTFCVSPFMDGYFYFTWVKT